MSNTLISLTCDRGWQRLLLLLFTFHLSLITATAQEAAAPEDSVELDSLEVLGRIQTMQDNLKQIYMVTQMMPSDDQIDRLKEDVAKVIASRVKVAGRALSQLDFKWNAWFQSVQADIAESDGLMEAAAECQQMAQSVKDSLDSMAGRIDLLIAFCETETFIPTLEPQYKQWFKEAMTLSLTAKLAPMLEKLKGKEALTFADIEARYAKAKEAADAMPGLQKRMDVIEQNYIVLKDTSTKIQAAAYKPLIQRVKDWLMGLACVAILLMFLNMVQAKIKAFKQARENMKKMQEMMNGGNNPFYPTI